LSAETERPEGWSLQPNDNTGHQAININARGQTRVLIE
jgi:hypothetical protein